MEAVQDKPKPEPPGPGMYVAVLLELCIAATLAANRSVLGMLLAALYAPWSATWSLFARIFRDDDR